MGRQMKEVQLHYLSSNEVNPALVLRPSCAPKKSGRESREA